MIPTEVISSILLLAGAVFFLAGTLGLLRFPDVYTRLHALTKADNVGLGLVILGLAAQAANGLVVVKLLIIWGLVMLASASISHLIAKRALQRGIKPWTR
ncbi:multisubunit sodium/proton antiporter, MrpG subunit [Ferrimonas sediminum]|uniref:Multisubunit sodium/proton antiporter, MrpG subunit n=1 Tax=Ferrimonas sediminum TaxID=718193 RepID=A0A1G8RHA4_9GAMM|nr:monovalent cation/H(+) antiporter subunit G [Ferrimonas sediminum]SDJ16484.1 multisubunit sodium/proton antiporter, MrpG subunit [Ferrimonas sediminum]